MNNNDLDLFDQFVRLEWLLHRYHQHNHRHHGPMGDSHRGQGRVLALLKLKPEISQKELSDILDIRSQSLGELLAKLERSGFITRTPSQTDRRVMEVSLTETGKTVSDQNEQQQRDTESLFSCLNQEEQSALSDYLSRIIDNLEQQFGNIEPGPHWHGHGHGPGHPPLDGRGFGPHCDRRGGHPPFHGRHFAQHFGGEGGRSPFDGREFGQNSKTEDKPDSSDGK